MAAAVRAAFAPEGALACDAAFRHRAQQQQMALAVAEAIEARDSLVVEAGTGVGKTWAYLVPILVSGRRAIVSTATKSLQDQLFLRDLPRLRQRLAVPMSTALLKGRSSYLCLHRLEQARRSALLPERAQAHTLARVERWAASTRSGDLAELQGLDDRSPVIPLVTSTRENCLGSDCPRWGDCHVVRARREAMAADLVVVNHHLFFADLMLRDSGVAELLPSVETAVFDEAHQLPEAGLPFLGIALGTGQLSDLARDLVASGLEQARGLAPWVELAAAVELAARSLRAACATETAGRGSTRREWSGQGDAGATVRALEEVRQAMSRIEAALDPLRPASPDLARLHERAAELGERAGVFMSQAPADKVRWVEAFQSSVRLVQSPLDIAEALTEQRQAAARAWIFTSATLGDDERLSWFTGGTGLSDARILRLGSPFDYPRQARLLTSSRFPAPQDEGQSGFVGAMAARCAWALEGRTFVLTTTLRALQPLAQALRQALHDAIAGSPAAGDTVQAAPWEVLVQGESPRRVLIERFGDGHHRVLVGSHSFWEGIDIPGPALQCVLIDRLPFPPPNDPLVQARQRRIEAEGGRAFEMLFVAEAAVALKQGAGRLIRSEDDQGLLVLCDPRIARMGYGRRLRQALPAMTGVASEAEAIGYLRELRAQQQSGYQSLQALPAPIG